jgi:hypothetical protein
MMIHDAELLTILNLLGQLGTTRNTVAVGTEGDGKC